MLTSTGSNSFGDSTISLDDGLMLFTFFRISTNTTIYGMEAALATGGTTGTVEGGQAVFTIHTFDDIQATPEIVSNTLAESAATTVNATDLTNGTLRGAFFQPALLTPGDYYAAATLYSNSGATHIRVLDDNTVPQPDAGSLIYLPIRSARMCPACMAMETPSRCVWCSIRPFQWARTRNSTRCAFTPILPTAT
ncbi:MAG: hypothetical protein IPK99_06140 [Flavobacteriales bacterium]|nr:hypothetical protein [Flavobacteriales bacterium]